MYDLNYTFLTELEVDTRQSFDDLSDDLLLLDKNAEESQIVDMKSVISSWQNYFWKSPNSNKQRLDVTFTDISVYHKTPPSVHQDYSGNALNDLEMMTFEELEAFFNSITWTGGKDWTTLTSDICNALTTLQAKYVNPNHIYPKKSVLVTNENPNGSGFGTWTERKNYYLSERFSTANYDISAGKNAGSGKITDIGLEPIANSVPNHTHKIAYIPATGSGGSSSEGSANPASTPLHWFNTRRGLDPTYIGPVTSQTAVQGHDIVSTSKAPRYKYSGKPTSRTDKWYYTSTVLRDANSTIEAGGEAGAKFGVGTAKVDPVDKKIKVAPKTYPLSAAIWERTGD